MLNIWRMESNNAVYRQFFNETKVGKFYTNKKIKN